MCIQAYRCIQGLDGLVYGRICGSSENAQSGRVLQDSSKRSVPHCTCRLLNESSPLALDNSFMDVTGARGSGCAESDHVRGGHEPLQSHYTVSVGDTSHGVCGLEIVVQWRNVLIIELRASLPKPRNPLGSCRAFAPPPADSQRRLRYLIRLLLMAPPILYATRQHLRHVSISAAR